MLLNKIEGIFVQWDKMQLRYNEIYFDADIQYC